MTKQKHAGGRPTKFDNQTVQLLDKVLKTGVSILTACDYVGIAPRTFYYWIENDGVFAQRMHAARKHLSVKAAETVAEAVGKKKNSDIALKVLERKETDEFGVKEKIEVAGKVEHFLTVGEALRLLNDKKSSGRKPSPEPEAVS